MYQFAHLQLSTLALAAALAWSSHSNLFAQRPLPPLNRPVIDEANLLSSSETAHIENLVRQIRAAGGPQIGVFIASSLENETIEGLSIRIVDQWKLGSAEKDDGLLLLIAPQERQMRIEVGQGLEGEIVDMHAKRIIDYVMAPAFRRQEFAAGIIAAIANLVKLADPEIYASLVARDSFGGSQTYADPGPTERPKLRPLNILLILLALWFLLGTKMGRLVLLGMLFSSRGSGRGGFGGGGFGGGGGFSGGGASGRW